MAQPNIQRDLNDKNDMRLQSGAKTYGKENKQNLVNRDAEDSTDDIQDSEAVETPNKRDIKSTNVESAKEKPSKFSRH